MESVEELIDSAMKHGQGIIMFDDDNTEIRFYALGGDKFMEVDQLTKKYQVITRAELKAKIEDTEIVQQNYDFILA